MNAEIIIKYRAISIICVLLLASCNKFEYSPYSAKVPEERTDLALQNINRINNLNLGEKYSFAIISDIHISYDELEKFILHINQENDISFIIITGDITGHGYYYEYDALLDYLEKLSMPYLTVIGNHDCYCNGDIIYREMFGDLNYSLIIGRVKYIFFESNINSNPDIDINWLRNEINDTVSSEKCILFSHISPYSFDDELYGTTKEYYKDCLSGAGLLYSFFGHEHTWYDISWLRIACTDRISNLNYNKVCVDSTDIMITQIFF